jgi:hypothetical protein
MPGGPSGGNSEDAAASVVPNNLPCERFLPPTNRTEHFRQRFLRLFATLRATVAALYLDECRGSNPRAAFRDALLLAAFALNLRQLFLPTRERPVPSQRGINPPVARLPLISSTMFHAL